MRQNTSTAQPTRPSGPERSTSWSRSPLPTFVGFMLTNGTPRVTKIREARQLLRSAEPYNRVDHYFHLRRPLDEALLAGGDAQPLLDCLRSLEDPKKREGHEAIVKGLTKFFRKHEFHAKAVGKRPWRHGDLEVTVRPNAILTMGGQDQVAFVHLKAEPLNARLVAPMLQLLDQTHGDLGAPMIVEARTGKVFQPSKSAKTRRGLNALLAAEAQAFVELWNGNLEAA